MLRRPLVILFALAVIAIPSIIWAQAPQAPAPFLIKAKIDAARTVAGGSGDLFMISCSAVRQDGMVDLASGAVVTYGFHVGNGYKQVTYSQYMAQGMMTDYPASGQTFASIDVARLQDSDRLCAAARTAGATFPTTLAIMVNAGMGNDPLAMFGTSQIINAYTGNPWTPGSH